MDAEGAKTNSDVNLGKSLGDDADGKGGSLVNGVSNGYKEHKSHHSSSSKHRDKDRHHSDKDKDRHKHSSSSKSSHKDKERDKDRERKHGEEKKSSSHEHKSSKDKEKEHKSSKDKEHKSSSSKDKHHSSSSGNKEKERDRHSSSHRDKDKHNSSSSKDKEKHNSSPTKDKHHSSSGSSKDKEREKDKHGSKDKDRYREKDKERDKSKSHSEHGREKSKENRDKDREREKKREKKAEEVIVKEEEPENDGMGDSAPEESLQIDEDHGRGRPMEVDEEEKEDVKQAIKEESEDETPLAFRTPKRERDEEEEEDEDDTPLFQRVKKNRRDDDEEEPRKKSKAKKRKSRAEESEEEDYYKPAKKKPTKAVKTETPSPRKGKKEDEPEVWRWWEEDKKDDGTKWKFLEHKGPMFAPAYERVPKKVKFYYDGKEMELSQDAEEVATFYAKMLEHDYTSKDAFNTNFFHDWRKVMTSKEREKIKDLGKCNFKPMAIFFKEKTEERKAMSKEEKKKIKEQNDEIQKEFGFCQIDGHKEKIGNFRIEPPGLFRGRGEHPKMGMLKRRVMPEDVIINCSKDSKVPTPPSGHKWKKVQNDPTVTWLASWTENVQGNVKYVMLNPSSKLKGEKDMMKYETARKLAKKINRIRDQYQADWKSKEMRIRQRAVALYFIDRLALRAGNEKDEDQADTVGCCSLRVEHVELHEELNGKENVVVFDFLGKDSIRYYNEVPVEKRVFKNLMLFKENKQGQDDLFDRLNTTVLNKHLNELMEGLTAKVFRTYNASWTLQEQLNKLTDPDDTVAEKILSYNRANRAVAILCNHQRAVPKSHEKSMENLKAKKEAKIEQIDEVKREMKDAKRSGDSSNHEKKKKQLERLKEQLLKLQVQETDREENKTIALGTSKLNYLDPRISVAWCKKFDVPIEKIYNKTQRDKFRWAIDMAGPDYVF